MHSPIVEVGHDWIRYDAVAEDFPDHRITHTRSITREYTPKYQRDYGRTQSYHPPKRASDITDESFFSDLPTGKYGRGCQSKEDPHTVIY